LQYPPRPRPLPHGSPGATVPELDVFVAGSVPAPLFPAAAVAVTGTYVQISPWDDLCQAGEVTIRSDADGQYPQISAELFAVRRIPA
jgi:hypothetical protein